MNLSNQICKSSETGVPALLEQLDVELHNLADAISRVRIKTETARIESPCNPECCDKAPKPILSPIENVLINVSERVNMATRNLHQIADELRL